MGQKTHPTGFRLGVIRSWDSRWFREKGYAEWLHEDIKLRDGNLLNSIDYCRVPQTKCVEPAASARSAGSCAIFSASPSEAFARFIFELGWQRTVPNAR